MEVLTLLAFLELLGGGGLSRPAPAPTPGPPGPPGPPGGGAGPAVQPAVFVPPGPGPAPAVVPPAPGPAPGPAPAPPVAPGTLPPMPPWPSPPPPGTLPPFPGAGWCPDTPVSAAVASRAAYWNPQLWDYPSKSVRKAFVQESMGGQWVTFAAAWHPGSAGPKTYMATEAWRVCTAPPVAPVAPAPVPVPHAIPPPGTNVGPPPPVGPEPGAGAWRTNAAYIKRYQSALSWLSGGSSKYDPKGVDGKYGPNTAAAVRAFQSDHGLTADGQCGNVTSAAIDRAMGYTPLVQPAPGVPPAPAPPAPAPMPAGPPGLVSPYPGPGAWQTNTQYIARYQNALAWLSAKTGTAAWNPQGVDGKYGPHTASAVKAFQAAHGLTADGMAGAQTAAALDAALQTP